MISINFTGNTLAELHTQAFEFCYALSDTQAAKQPVPVGEDEAVDPLPLAGEPPITTGAEKAANEAIKRTRRTKAEMEAARAAVEPEQDLDPIKTAVEMTQKSPAPAAEPPTMLDVKAAAMRVVERDGLGQEAAFAIVKSFGVTRISALEEIQFVAFVDACNAKLAG